MPHLFLLAKCFACDAYLVLGVWLYVGTLTKPGLEEAIFPTLGWAVARVYVKRVRVRIWRGVPTSFYSLIVMFLTKRDTPQYYSPFNYPNKIHRSYRHHPKNITYNSFCNITPHGRPICMIPPKQLWNRYGSTLGTPKFGWFETLSFKMTPCGSMVPSCQETVEVLPSKVTSAGDKPVVSPGPGIWSFKSHGGFHSHGGTPIAGEFISWKIPFKWKIWKGAPILKKPANVHGKWSWRN